jgi:hypothetical protein
MQSSELFPKSDEEIQKEYNQKLFLKTLKEGKMPIRKCLFKNIFYLSGIYNKVRQIQSSSTDDSVYDKSYQIILNTDKPSIVIDNPNFINSLKRYLDNHFILKDDSWGYFRTGIRIHFNSNKVRWDLIDHDLRTKHPKNILIKANGFAYVKNYYLKVI